MLLVNNTSSELEFRWLSIHLVGSDRPSWKLVAGCPYSMALRKWWSRSVGALMCSHSSIVKSNRSIILYQVQGSGFKFHRGLPNYRYSLLWFWVMLSWRKLMPLFMSSEHLFQMTRKSANRPFRLWFLNHPSIWRLSHGIFVHRTLLILRRIQWGSKSFAKSTGILCAKYKNRVTYHSKYYMKWMTSEDKL